MNNLKIQFELGQRELRRARKVFRPPANNGWAVLVMLLIGYVVGAPALMFTGAWSLLLFSGVAYLGLAARVVWRVAQARKKLSPIASTVVLNDMGISTTTNASESCAAWTSYSEFIETNDHFFLRTFESVTTLPKRAMTPDQIVLVRETLQSRINSDSSENPEIGLFERYLPDGDNQVFSFTWDQAILKKLLRTRFFPLAHSSRTPTSSRWGVQAVLTFGILVGAWMLFSSFQHLLSGPQGDWRRIRSSLIMVGALTGPMFAIAGFLFQRLRTRYRLKRARLPTQMVRVCLTNDSIVMGVPESAGRVALVDITAFFLGTGFIGFQLYDGFVHTLPSQAFGGDENALNFVREADRQRISILRKDSSENTLPAESDNPYQSPRGT